MMVLIAALPLIAVGVAAVACTAPFTMSAEPSLIANVGVVSPPSTRNVPALRVAAATLLPAAVSTVVPVPIWLSAPEPEMTPPNVIVSLRLNASTPSFATSPTIEPEVPPSPSCKVPATIVVPPVPVLSAVSTVVPVPI